VMMLDMPRYSHMHWDEAHIMHMMIDVSTGMHMFGWVKLILGMHVQTTPREINRHCIGTSF